MKLYYILIKIFWSDLMKFDKVWSELIISDIRTNRLRGVALYYCLYRIRCYEYMKKFPKWHTLTSDKKSINFFGEHTYPIAFFQPVLTPRTISNSLKKKLSFAKLDFSSFALFSIFLNSTQSEFSCYKREFICTATIP